MKRKALARDSHQYIEGFSNSLASKSDKLLRVLQSNLMMDLLSCVLLTTGLGLAALTLTALDTGFWSCFGFACVSSFVILIFSLQWWIAPVTAVASVSLAVLYYGVSGRLKAVASYCFGLFAWALQGAPYNTIYSENGGAVILEAAIIFVIALLCFIFVRKLFFLPVIFLLICTYFSVVYYFGHADLSVPLCACASGMIILLPRIYSRYVSLHSGKSEKRGAMQVVAVPAAIFAMLLALWFIPQNTSAWKSRGLGNFIADIAYMFEGPFHSYPSNASGFSMEGMGFGQENGRLGGPVQLTDEKYLSVITDSPMLLRGSIMDYYTGESWQIGAPDGDFRFDSLFWRSSRSTAFGMNKPLGGEAKKLFDSLTFLQEPVINYHTSKFNTIFSGGILHDAGFEKNGIIEPIYFNMRSELYLHYRIPSSETLLLKTRVWNTGLPGFEESFLRLEELAANRGDKDFLQIRERYTRLPDTVPESVKEFAHKITADSKSPYEKAKAIERWLRENCEYTLEPVTPPENIDFVEHFLNTRKGYCTYYASAVAVLARCVGLPSRYVTGFGLEQDSRKAALYLATGETVHAWAEVYFDGIGWIEFDPLGLNPSTPLNQEYTDLPDSNPQPGLTQSHATNPIPDETVEQTIPARSRLSLYQAVLYVFVLALMYFAAHLSVYHIMRQKLKIYEFSRVSRKIPSLGKRIDFYFNDILKQLSLLGIDAYAGETLTAFSARVDRRLKLDGKSFAAISDAQMRLHFAESAPTEADCESAFHYHNELELLLRERLGKTAYFFKRAVRR